MSKRRKTDFFYLKAYCEMILTRLGLHPDNLKIDATDKDIFREGLTYKAGDKHIVSMGILSKASLKKADVNQEVYYAEFSWGKHSESHQKPQGNPTPATEVSFCKRDLALLLDKKVTFKEIKETAFRTEKIITEIRHVIRRVRGRKTRYRQEVPTPSVSPFSTKRRPSRTNRSTKS